MVQDNSPASPVDEAFEELFEVIPELKMFTSAQVVPGADNADPDKLMTGSLSLEEARMYKSEPDLRVKYEGSEAPNPCSFGEVSQWLQCSMQLGDLRQHPNARDPFICARDPYAYQEQIQRELMESAEWRPPVLPAMALIRQESPSEIDKMLISQAQNVCQQGCRRDLPTESQCKVFMPSFWDAQMVNDSEPWYDHLEVDYREATFPGGLRHSLFKLDSEGNSPRDLDLQAEDRDLMRMQERDSESPDSFTSTESVQERVWTPRGIPATKPVEVKTAFRKVEQRKFVMHKNQKTTFKSGRPRLCQFLFELLDNPDQYAYMIEWLDKDKGVFKFLNSGEVARLWGRRRNKPSMKYENFARSLRTYIAKGILTKPRSKLVYQFATTRN